MSWFSQFTSTFGGGASRILGGLGDEALWDLIKTIVHRLGGRLNETEVHEQDQQAGDVRVRVVRQAERAPKVEFTNRLAQVMAKMKAKNPEALTKLLGYIAEAVLGTDPLPGGEDALSRALARFIPPGDDDVAYDRGADNLIAIVSVGGRAEFYTIIRVATKDPALEDAKRLIDAAIRLGIDLWPHIDAQFARWAVRIDARTAIAKLQREAKGRPMPTGIKALMRDEYVNLTKEGLSDKEIVDAFRARGYTPLLAK